MQKRYQIESQRAVQQFHQFASEVNPTVQTILPMADIVGMLQEGVGHLMREAGLLLMMGIMEEEVRHVRRGACGAHADERCASSSQVASRAHEDRRLREGRSGRSRRAPSGSVDETARPLG